MFISLFHLQAAMGLGILLVMIAMFLLVVALPALIIFFTMHSIFKLKKENEFLGKKDYALALLKGCVYSILTLFAIVLILSLFLYCCVDLTYS